MLVIHGESIDVQRYEQSIALIGEAWNIPTEDTERLLSQVQKEKDAVSNGAAHVLPETELPMNATGMDMAFPTGTPIRAALPGTVTVSQYNAGGYGYYVMIDHGNGLSTLYAHNSKLLVRVGQTVEAGDIISLSGSAGRSTGPHLHFEVRVNGERTDPRYYLP